MDVVWDNETKEYGLEVVGGKGKNLLRIVQIAREENRFQVPSFGIINPSQRITHEYLQGLFERVRYPLIVRSSSPNEDGENASFAGIFKSIPQVGSLDKLASAINEVRASADTERARNYAKRMGVTLSGQMPVIVMNEVPWLEKGIAQLDDLEGHVNRTFRNGESWEHEVDYDFLKEYPSEIYKEPHDFISEGEHHYVNQEALRLKTKFNHAGIVQVEFCQNPSELPNFVQYRRLPPRKNRVHDLSQGSKGIIIESEVCNDVAGELVLPAYVTVSQAGFPQLCIGTGQTSLLRGLGKADDSRKEDFRVNSALARNLDFIDMKRVVSRLGHTLMDLDDSGIHELNKIWRRGNSLFKDYVLVCDKLDETHVGMDELTANKRAIITCSEANKTSHAMTVARDLGIMCLGARMDWTDWSSFYHQVETGDSVHIESDGRNAVAWIEQKRERDPYKT